MIVEFIDRFQEIKGELLKEFSEKEPDSYEDIFKITLKHMFKNPTYQEPDYNKKGCHVLPVRPALEFNPKIKLDKTTIIDIANKAYTDVMNKQPPKTTPVVINLVGEPSVGKSTVAAELFASMKKQGYSVELVTEYAKDIVWENRQDILKHQDYVFAKQHRRLSRLIGKVDYIITDSPLILSLLYIEMSNTPRSLIPFIQDVISTYKNIYVYLKRAHKYEEVGRMQNELEANNLRQKLNSILTDNGVVPLVISTDDTVVDLIINHIKGIDAYKCK